VDNYEHLVLISLYDETIPKPNGEPGLLAIIQIMSGDGANKGLEGQVDTPITVVVTLHGYELLGII
jgi:hypothetical protein